MKWYFNTAVIAGLLFVAADARTGGLFSSRQKPADVQQFINLINNVQSSQNAGERERAAEQLRNYDASKFREVVPILVNVLRMDKSINVRIEAARSLGRIRPLTSAAREALAEASLRDSAFRVRWQARTSLAVYTVRIINPNNHASSDAAAKVTVKEPPIGKGKPNFPPQQNPLPNNPGNKDNPYARPLPKGPEQPPIVENPPPLQPPAGTLIPVPVPQNSTPVVPTAPPPLSPPPAANPQPLPLIPPLPSTPPTGDDGPVLAPPGQ